MLSLSNLSAGQAASGYYSSEGYYIEGASEQEHTTEYYGVGAKEAGFEGAVNEQTFGELLEGQAPDGRLMGRIRDGEREHRPGLDMTFSAPKSVSVAALVGEDTRILQAHKEAVKETLDYAEKNVVQFRQVVGGDVMVKTGGKMIAGLFQHDTSRALDPQLHTHAVIANMVKGDDGEYRALHNDSLMKNKMMLGQMYRNALAEQLQVLGYEIERGEKGLIEIVGVPKDVTDMFSKRRDEIQSSLEDRNMEGNARNSALAALATRASKKPVSRDELRAAWAPETKELGIDAKAMVAGLTEGRGPIAMVDEQRRGLSERATDFAITHFAERASVYSRADVMTMAMQYDPSVSGKQVQAYLKTLVSEKVLHPVVRENELHFTDTENIRLETENARLLRLGGNRPRLDMRSNYDKLVSRSSDSAVSKTVSQSTLTEGQKEAVEVILGSSIRTVGVQGSAGTGKTYMLDTVKRLAEKRDYQIEGLAPSLKAVAALGEAIPSASTVESALTKHENGLRGGDKSRTILVVDEASMMSSKQMNRVLQMAQDKGYVRVALVGDVKQLDSVGAGAAFKALQDAGLKTAYMTDIQRQRTDEGRNAVVAALGGQISKAMTGISRIEETGLVNEEIRDQFKTLRSSLISKEQTEIQERLGLQKPLRVSKERFAQIGRQAAESLKESGAGANGTGFKTVSERRAQVASKISDEWLARNDDERSRTGVIALTNELRVAINQRIQSGLLEEGKLKGKGVDIKGLDPANFTEAEAREIRSYQPGDIVVAMVAKPNARLEAGAQYVVEKTEVETNTLSLRASDGRKVDLDLSNVSKATEKLAVFSEKTETFYQGESVKFKITDRAHGIENSAQGRIASVSSDTVELVREDGEKLSLPTRSVAVQGMQLAYSATAHDFQGSTVDRVLLGMLSTEQLSDQKSFYVGLSRMRDETVLVTDDAQKLASTIQKNTGERVGALQALAEENQRLKQEAESERKEAEKQPEKEAPAQGELPLENTPKSPFVERVQARIEKQQETYGLNPSEEDVQRAAQEIIKDQKIRGERER